VWLPGLLVTVASCVSLPVDSRQAAQSPSPGSRSSPPSEAAGLETVDGCLRGPQPSAAALELFGALGSACFLAGSTAIGFRSGVDGFPFHKVGWLGLACAGLPDTHGLGEKRIKHELAHTKKLGVLSGDVVQWRDWWEFPERDWATMRCLARGGSWRFFTGPHGDMEQAWCRTIEGKTGACRPRNYVRSGELLRWKRRLRREGWLVRKEDRGKRLVFVPTKWEAEAWAEECSRRGISRAWEDDDELTAVAGCEGIADSRVSARIYFLPKTHKPVVSGRCVERWGKASLKGIAPIVGALKRCHWRLTAVQDVHRVLTGGNTGAKPSLLRIISGDVEKLFPSVPFEELISLLPSNHPNLAFRLKTWRSRCRLSFAGTSWYPERGLPIGHPWSPALAEYYLFMKEQGFVQWLEKGGGCMGRYVDDSVFALPRGLATGRDDAVGQAGVARVKSRYADALHPLKVTWGSDGVGSGSFPVLDLSVGRANLSKLRVAFNDKKRGWVGGAIPRTNLVAVVAERVRRLAEVECLARNSGGERGLWTRMDVLLEWEDRRARRVPLPVDVIALLKDWRARGFAGVFRAGWMAAIKPVGARRGDPTITLEWIPALESRRGKLLVHKLAASRAKSLGCLRCAVRWKFSMVTTLPRLLHW